MRSRTQQELNERIELAERLCPSNKIRDGVIPKACILQTTLYFLEPDASSIAAGLAVGILSRHEGSLNVVAVFQM